MGSSPPLPVSTDSTPLRIGADFALPLEAVTDTFAILAKRGAGKTNTAVVLVEELLAHGQQAIVVDPVGVWFGLRAPGTGPGLPVVIIGGEHADLPLAETAGRELARLLVAVRGGGARLGVAAATGALDCPTAGRVGRLGSHRAAE